MYTKDQSKLHHNDNNNNQTKAHQDDYATLHQDFQKIKEKARETRDAITQTATDVRDALTQRATDARGKAEDVLKRSITDARDLSVDLQENIVTFVKSHPVKSITFAVLAGLVLSQLLKK